METYAGHLSSKMRTVGATTIINTLSLSLVNDIDHVIWLVLDTTTLPDSTEEVIIYH